MKKIIVMCRQEGCTGISYMGDINTVYSGKRLASDINKIAAVAEKCGYETCVANLHVHALWWKASTFYLDHLADNVTRLEIRKIGECAREAAGVIFLGIPAKAGTESAFMAGTYNYVGWHDYLINDECVGECGIYKTYFDSLGVPVIFIIGDRAVCEEMTPLIGKDSTVTTKTAKFRNIADCRPESEVYGELESRLAAVLKKGEFEKPHSPLPVTVRIEYNRTDFCDDAYGRSNWTVRRLSPRTLEKTVDKINSIFDLTI